MEDARPSTPHRLNAPEPDQAAAGHDPRDSKDARLLARGPTPTATTPRGRKSPTPLTPRTLRRITSTDVPDEIVDQVPASDGAAVGRVTRATLRRRSQASGEVADSAGPQAHLSEVDEDVDVEPLLGGAAAAPPRTRAAPRRGSSSSSGLGFWGTSALVLVVSCLVSAVLLRGIPGVLPPLAGPRLPAVPPAPVTPAAPRAAPGQLDAVQRFLEWQSPGWHEAGAVDLSTLPTQPTAEQCAQWGDLPAMQILCSGLNPLNPVAAS